MFQFDPNHNLLREEQYAVLSADGYSVASISHGDNGSFDPGPLFARRLQTPNTQAKEQIA
jgi:hypothetical protein